ncbi:hypothetical protein ACVWXS_000627 [Lysinibacillus sp. TE18511]
MSRFTRFARSRVSGQQDVGHEGVITGRDGFSLRSSIANPQGVAHSPLQSTYRQDIRFKMSSTTFDDEPDSGISLISIPIFERFDDLLPFLNTQ